MNQISSALAQAGVKLPSLLQRVWQILHDSKVPRSGKVLASMLNLPQAHVSSALNKLYSRGMVAIARHELTHCKGPRGSTRKALVAQYAALGTEYELLPVLPTTKVEPQPQLAADIEQRFLRPSPQPATIDIEKMTLAEAHALYKRLQEFFT
jgi:DNA-binding transcriptional ArsR family regulator